MQNFIYDKIGKVIESFIWDDKCLNRMRNRVKWSTKVHHFSWLCMHNAIPTKEL